MFKKAQRVCPICGGYQCEVLHSQKFFLPDNMMLPDVYDIVSCLKCEFVYADTPASQKEYDLFYTKMSKYEEPKIASGGGNTQWDKERLEIVANDLLKFIDKSAAVLDIGCANGGLLAILKKHGFMNLTGLDPSPSCVSYVEQTHRIRAIQGGIFNGKHLNKSFNDEKFDLIILSHVLEHICDLQLAIDIIGNILKDQALLYIETPDAARYHKYPKVPFYYFDCEHINHFDLQHLKILFENKGFCVEWQTQKDFPVSEKMSYPAVAIVLRNHGNKKSNINYEGSAKLGVKKHIEQSRVMQYTKNINLLADEYEEIVVWGTGQYTFRMLENSRLKDCNIAAFIDNDKSKQGMTINGRKVYGPEYLKKKNSTVLVCAAIYTDDIVKQIKDMGIERKILSPSEIFNNYN